MFELARTEVTMTDRQRLFECLLCPYMDECIKTIENPEEHKDGSRKEKEVFESTRTRDLHTPL